MKTYAPKGLEGGDLRGLLDQLVASPQEVAKFLHVTERSVWRWLADGSAPFAVLAALWHETAHGREVTSCDVGNDLVLTRAGKRIAQEGETRAVGQLARVLAISDTGAANEPLISGALSQRFEFSKAHRQKTHAPGPGCASVLHKHGCNSECLEILHLTR